MLVQGDPSLVRVEKSGRQSCNGRFSRARGTDQGRHAAWWCIEADVMKNLLAFLIAKGDPFKSDVSLDLPDHVGSNHWVVFFLHLHELLRPVKACHGLGELASDVAHLDDGCDHESQKEGEGHKFSIGHLSVHDEVAPDPHDPSRGQSKQKGGRAGHQGSGRKAFLDVEEQPFNAFLEGPLFLCFCVEALDHPDPVQGFRQPPGHLGIDLAPVPEDGPDVPEGFQGDHCKECDGHQHEKGHGGVDLDQDHERDDRCERAPDELHQSGAHQVPHSLHIGHHTGNQGPGLVVVEEPDRQGQ